MTVAAYSAGNRRTKPLLDSLMRFRKQNYVLGLASNNLSYVIYLDQPNHPP